jgi:hypothetical protein
MDTLIQNLQYSSTTVQALAVTVGGLAGVFVTLTAFFLVMFLAVKLSKKEASD